MRKHYIKLLVLGVFFLTFGLTVFLNAAGMDKRIYRATRILKSKQASEYPIPRKILSHAKGVAIFDITEAGLGIGGTGGEGIVVAKKGDSWTAPSAFDIGGASLGAQIGFTENRYIVILKTDEALRYFTRPGKINWNATATGTVGSDTGTASASTKRLKGGSVVVYKSTEGAFGGAVLGGSSLDIRSDINRRAYGKVQTRDILNGKIRPPKSAKRLYQLLNGKA